MMHPQQQVHNQVYPGQQPVMAQSEIYQVLAPMTLQLGLPNEKIYEYGQVFERHEIHNQKALFMLSETDLTSITSECAMGIPA